MLSDSVAVEPAAVLHDLAGRTDRLGVAEEDWLGGWRSADERAAEALLGVLSRAGLSEPGVAAELGVLLPAGGTLFVASSMPVRDIEAFWPVRQDPPRVLCNRGANGIDGTVASAFGAAAGQSLRGTYGAVVLMIGDVALAHDIGSLIAAGRLQLKLTIVLLENAGGGIFDFLPVAKAESAREVYLEHVVTAPELDFGRAAALCGLEHVRPETLPSFREALEQALASEGSTMIEVRSERAANLELHREAWQAAVAALEAP